MACSSPCFCTGACEGRGCSNGHSWTYPAKTSDPIVISTPRKIRSIEYFPDGKIKRIEYDD